MVLVRARRRRPVKLVDPYFGRAIVVHPHQDIQLVFTNRQNNPKDMSASVRIDGPCLKKGEPELVLTKNGRLDSVVTITHAFDMSEWAERAGRKHIGTIEIQGDKQTIQLPVLLEPSSRCGEYAVDRIVSFNPTNGHVAIGGDQVLHVVFDVNDATSMRLYSMSSNKETYSRLTVLRTEKVYLDEGQLSYSPAGLFDPGVWDTGLTVQDWRSPLRCQYHFWFGVSPTSGWDECPGGSCEQITWCLGTETMKLTVDVHPASKYPKRFSSLLWNDLLEAGEKDGLSSRRFDAKACSIICPYRAETVDILDEPNGTFLVELPPVSASPSGKEEADWSQVKTTRCGWDIAVASLSSKIRLKVVRLVPREINSVQIARFLVVPINKDKPEGVKSLCMGEVTFLPVFGDGTDGVRLGQRKFTFWLVQPGDRTYPLERRPEKSVASLSVLPYDFSGRTSVSDRRPIHWINTVDIIEVDNPQGIESFGVSVELHSIVLPYKFTRLKKSDFASSRTATVSAGNTQTESFFNPHHNTKIFMRYNGSLCVRLPIEETNGVGVDSWKVAKTTNDGHQLECLSSVLEMHEGKLCNKFNFRHLFSLGGTWGTVRSGQIAEIVFFTKRDMRQIFVHPLVPNTSPNISPTLSSHALEDKRTPASDRESSPSGEIIHPSGVDPQGLPVYCVWRSDSTLILQGKATDKFAVEFPSIGQHSSAWSLNDKSRVIRYLGCSAISSVNQFFYFSVEDAIQGDSLNMLFYNDRGELRRVYLRMAQGG